MIDIIEKQIGRLTMRLFRDKAGALALSVADGSVHVTSTVAIDDADDFEVVALMVRKTLAPAKPSAAIQQMIGSGACELPA